MANLFSMLALRTPWTIWKDKKIGQWKKNSPGLQVPNMLLEINGEIILERMKFWSQSKNKAQWWMRLVIEARSNYCSKEQYWIGTWNVRSVNQGKLEVVKQEMARVSIDILGISKQKWTEMGEFNSDDYYIYDCGQESLRRNGVALIVNKTVQNTVLGWNLKWQNDLCSFPRQTIQYHSNPSLCPNQWCWRSWTVLWRPTRPSRTNTQNRCPFHYSGLERKSKRYLE